MIEATKHPLYELCRRAYYHTSFSPEKRAESEIAYYNERVTEFQQLCGDNLDRCDDIINKFTTKFKAHMEAKGRCISSMITGPANFPVARAEKANNRERAAGDEVLNFVEKVRKNIDKEKNPHKHGISSDHVDALELLKNKLARLEKLQADMKLINKIHAVYKKAPESEATQKLMAGINEGYKNIIKNYVPRYSWEPHPFAPFELTNNNATIKTTKKRVIELEAKQGQESRETVVKGVRVVESVEENRIQLFFDGKPAAEIIAMLKSHGMRWSPRGGCWQRMLNNNGRYAVKQILLKINN